jgi:hypothetical protein
VFAHIASTTCGANVVKAPNAPSLRSFSSQELSVSLVFTIPLFDRVSVPPVALHLILSIIVLSSLYNKQASLVNDTSVFVSRSLDIDTVEPHTTSVPLIWNL